MPAIVVPFVFLRASSQRFPGFTWVIFTGTLMPAFILLVAFFCRRLLMLRALEKATAAIEGRLPERLENGSILLIKSQWLKQHSRDGRWRQRLAQDDKDAFWPAGRGCPAVRLLREGKVAVLSYRWLEQVDPDPQITTDVDALTPVHELGRGYHERALVGFLEMHPNFEAVFWDVLSLCQHPPGGRRNDDEEAKFRGGLEVMGSLYASPNTMVVQSTQLPPSHASLKPFALSGWCQFEEAMGSLSAAVGGARLERRIVNLATGAPPTLRVSFGDATAPAGAFGDFPHAFKERFSPCTPSCADNGAVAGGEGVGGKGAPRSWPSHVTFTNGNEKDREKVFQLLDAFYADLVEADRRLTPCLVRLADRVYSGMTPPKICAAALVALILFLALMLATGELLGVALEVMAMILLLFIVCVYPSRQFQAANHCGCPSVGRCCTPRARKVKVGMSMPSQHRPTPSHDRVEHPSGISMGGRRVTTV